MRMPNRKLVFGLACAAALCAASAQAQDAATVLTAAAPTAAASAQGKPDLQPAAVDALGRMGTFLRSLPQFEVSADSVTDAVLDSGQNVGFLHHTDLEVRRPDRLRADISGNARDRGIVYNPLADLFYWGNGKEDELALQSAQFIGLERVDARWCNHFAYAQSGVDWELWLESGSRPLPCRMSITDTTQVSRPRHEVTYHWNLRPLFRAGTFDFSPAAGAHAIELKPAQTSPFEEAQ
jgi:hypothetical protein